MIVNVRSVWLWTFFKDQADFASHRYQVWRKHQLYLIAAQFILMQKFRMQWQRFPITTAGIWSSLVAFGSYNFQPLPFRLSCCSRLHRLFFLFENHVTQLCCCKQQPVAAKPLTPVSMQSKSPSRPRHQANSRPVTLLSLRSETFVLMAGDTLVFIRMCRATAVSM